MHQPRSSKLPSEWTLEELLEAANSPQEIVQSNDLTDHDVFTFINTLKILPGNKKLDKRLLFRLYRNWSKQPVTQVDFTRFIHMFFQYDNKYYHLNMDALEIIRIPHKSIRSIKRDSTKNKNRKRHFESFLNYYSITSGNNYLESSVLYYMYDKWTYNNKSKNPLGSNQFFKLCSIYFEKKRLTDSKVSFFGINDNINVSQEDLQKAQQWARKRNEKQTKEYKEANKKTSKKTNNAESNEVPGIEPKSESKE